MKKITKLLNFLAPLGFTLFICLDAFARAGGGSNGNGGWDEFLISIAFAPLFLAYGIYRNRQINTRAKEVSIVLEKLKQKDLNWDEAHLSALVKNTFFTAQ